MVQYAPATLRNREPILEVLLQVLPPQGTVLEIASGTGEHAVFFAPHLQPRQWLPSDPNPVARQSIVAWQKCCPSDNLHSPLALDVQNLDWSSDRHLQNQAIQLDQQESSALPVPRWGAGGMRVSEESHPQTNRQSQISAKHGGGRWTNKFRASTPGFFYLHGIQ
jgi:hypothetical protein